MPTCKTCGAAIFFVRHERTGSWMPFDEDPIDADETEAKHRWRIDAERSVCWLDRVSSGAVWVPHFATCAATRPYMAPPPQKTEVQFLIDVGMALGQFYLALGRGNDANRAYRIVAALKETSRVDRAWIERISTSWGEAILLMETRGQA